MPEESLAHLTDEQLETLEKMLADIEAAKGDVTDDEFAELVASLAPPPADTPTKPSTLAAGAPQVDWTGELLARMEPAVRSGVSESAALSAAIAEVVVLLAGTDADASVSSTRIADRAVAWRSDMADRRGAVDTRQTLDYVQFMLREADHVCRHQWKAGGFYRLHAEVECSSTCDEKHLSSSAYQAVPQQRCHGCFVEVALTLDECEMCGAPLGVPA